MYTSIFILIFLLAHLLSQFNVYVSPNADSQERDDWTHPGDCATVPTSPVFCLIFSAAVGEVFVVVVVV